MEIFIVKAISTLVLPPGVFLALGVLGLVLWRRLRLLATLCLVLSFGGLYVFSTPAVGDALIASLERHAPRLPGEAVPADAGAVVVLGGGRNANAAEYGGETVSASTLVRVRYGARLHDETGLPVAVSGGRVFGDGAAEALLMRDALSMDFGVEARWVESRSRNTAQNARMTRDLLLADGIAAALLVTHATHMPRAVAAFENVGFKVYPAPTGFASGAGGRPGLFDWLPSMNALGDSYAALHEHLGRLWYAIRY